MRKRFENSPFSLFARYEGSWTKLTGGGYFAQPLLDNGYFFRTTQHMAKVGFRVYLNENSLRYNDQMGATLDIRDAFTSVSRGLGRTLNAPPP